MKRSQFEVAAATVDSYLTLAAAQEIGPCGSSRRRPGGNDRAYDGSADQCAIAPRRRLLARASGAGGRANAIDSVAAGCRSGACDARAVCGSARPTRLSSRLPGCCSCRRRRLPATADFIDESRRGGAKRNRGAGARATEGAGKILLPQILAASALRMRAAQEPRLNGARLDGLNGLAPTVQNFALRLYRCVSRHGLCVDSREGSRSIRDHSRADGANRTNRDRVEERDGMLRSRNCAAQGHVAENTPGSGFGRRAMRPQQATARYQSGLGTIDQVAEAQRLLTQAEIDDGARPPGRVAGAARDWPRRPAIWSHSFGGEPVKRTIRESVQ